LKAIWTIADKRKDRLAQHNEDRPIGEAVELLKTNGFDGLADAVPHVASGNFVVNFANSLHSAAAQWQETEIRHPLRSEDIRSNL
jgi:hypothetical protein